jgi:predicted transcriptional regulator
MQSFLTLTAEELMSRDLVLVPREMSLRGAARLLFQARVTGAPVVDEDGRCIGVLSATDIIHWVERGESSPQNAAQAPPVMSDWQLITLEALPTDAVASYMSTDLVTVTPAARVTELARKMVQARVHRVIVVDEQQRPIGLVSSTNILAALAEAETGVKAPAAPRPSARAPTSLPGYCTVGEWSASGF